MSAAYAEVNDVIAISSADYDAAGYKRISVLLPLVSDLIRVEGAKCGKDVDTLVEEDSAYANVVKLVTCDVVIRAMRQSASGEPLSQESQAALGYSWSGSYAIPGGGVAMSLMRNEKKLLGFRQQHYGTIELWESSEE